MAVFGARFDQTGLEQSAKLQGNGAEGDVGHGLVNGAGAEFVAPNETKYFAAARGSQCIEGGRIRKHIYTLD